MFPEAASSAEIGSVDFWQKWGKYGVLMELALKRLTALSLLFLFALGVACVSFSAPGYSAALVAGSAGLPPGCAENSAALEKRGCNYPTFICRTGSTLLAFSATALTSLQNRDFSKDAKFSILVVLPAISSDDKFLVGDGPMTASAIYAEGKVSLYLFNSVLTL